MKDGVVLMYCTVNIIGEWAYNSININRKYAEKNNYDFELITEPYDTLYTHAWQKIPAMINLLERGYKFVIYIDADAVVNKSDIKIESFLEKYSGDIIVCSDEANSGGKCKVNGGVIIARNTEKAKNFLMQWWNLRSVYLTFSYEQQALSDITENKINGIDGSIVSIAPENEFNSIYAEMLIYSYSYRLRKPDNFIYHFMATDGNHRKRILSYLNERDCHYDFYFIIAAIIVIIIAFVVGHRYGNSIFAYV